MQVAIRRAEALGASYDPVVFVGEPGSGRRSLARCTAKEGRVAELAAAELVGLDGMEVHRRLDTYLGAGVVVLENADQLDEVARTVVRARGAARLRLTVSEPLSEVWGRLARAPVVRVPSLRERREDVPGLFLRALEAAAEELGAEVPEVTADCLDALLAYDWPGNLAELESTAERVAIATRKSGVANVEALPAALRRAAREAKAATIEPLDVAIRRYIVQAIEIAGGRKNVAARALGLSPRALRRRLNGR